MQIVGGGGGFKALRLGPGNQVGGVQQLALDVESARRGILRRDRGGLGDRRSQSGCFIVAPVALFAQFAVVLNGGFQTRQRAVLDQFVDQSVRQGLDGHQRLGCATAASDGARRVGLGLEDGSLLCLRQLPERVPVVVDGLVAGTGGRADQGFVQP
ncbi:hypothetical protein D3C86_1072690 [compost metagenome]